MERVVQLSSVKLNTSTTSVLEFLMDKDRPIFFRVPDNKNVWVIKRACHELLKCLQEAQNTKNVISASPLTGTTMGWKQKYERDRQKITDAQLIKEVSYGCLGTYELSILLTNKFIKNQ